MHKGGVSLDLRFGLGDDSRYFYNLVGMPFDDWDWRFTFLFFWQLKSASNGRIEMKLLLLRIFPYLFLSSFLYST